MPESTQIIIQKRVRSHQLPRCTNPECGASERHLFRLKRWCTKDHTVYKCHECGEFVVEGDVLKFCDDMTHTLQEKEKAKTLFSICEQALDG